MRREFQRSGQTIVEAMVAIGLLIIGFLGVITLLNRSIGLNRVVADNYAATYLAAEGIEVTKNLLDSNFVNGNSFATHFEACTDGCDWEVQYDSEWEDPLHQPQPYTGRLLYYNPSGLYTYDAFGDATPFTRRVTVTLGGQGDRELTVHSVVSWRGRGGTLSSVDLEDHFFDWFTTQ